MHFADNQDKNSSSNVNHNDMQRFLGSQDKVINLTSWKALKSGGKKFKSHNLIKVNDHQIIFKISKRTIALYTFMFLLGLLTVIIFLFGNVLGMDGSGNPLYGIAIGFVFMLVGSFLLITQSAQINLDNKLPAFWMGKLDANAIINKNSLEAYASLKELHALQVIKEFLPDNSSNEGWRRKGLTSYEINLVMNDGSRINILDHGNKKEIDRQAQEIATFFNVPLWHACPSIKEHYSFFQKLVALLNTRIFKAGLVFVFILFSAYWTYAENKQEDTRLANLSLHDAKVLAQKSTKELMYRVKNNTLSFPILNNLVRHKADIYTRDAQGLSPLFYAVQNRNYDMSTYFIKHGADIHIVDKEGHNLKSMLDPVKDKLLYEYIMEEEQRLVH